MAERMMDRILVVDVSGGEVTVQGLFPVPGGVKLGPAKRVPEGVAGGEAFEGWFQEQHRELRGMVPGFKKAEVPKEASRASGRTVKTK